MSTVASLQVKLGADVSAAINGLSKSEFAALKVADSFAKAAESSQQYGTLATVAGTKVAQVAQGAQSILNNIKFDRLTQEGEKSFNSLQKVVDMTANAGNAATLIGAGFVQAQNVANVALTGVAAAVPRLGVAIAGLAGPIGLAIGAVGALVGAFISWKTAQDNTIDRQKEITNQTIAEVSQLDVYFNVLRNGNLTYEKRGDLIDKINDKYGTTIKNLKDETAFVGQVETAYNQLTTALTNKIKVNVIGNELEANIIRIRELQKKISEIPANGKTIQSTFPFNENTLGIKKGVIDSYKEDIAELEAANKKLEDEYAKLFNGIIFEDDKKKGGSGKTAAEQVADVYKDLENTLTGIQSRLKDSNFAIFPEVQNLNTSAYESAINKLYDIDPTGASSKKAVEGFKKLFAGINGVIPLPRQNVINDDQIRQILNPNGFITVAGQTARQAIEAINDEFNNQKNLIKFNALPDGVNGLEKFIDKYVGQIQKGISVTGELGNKVLDIANLAGNFEGRLNELENYYTREDELIQNSIASDSVKAARKKALEDDVNRKRKAILREQAQAQKASALFNAIINTAQGVSSALATANLPLAALVGALGSVEIGLIAGQPIPALQAGALISGPNTVLVGEYSGASSNPELISPVDKVKKYIVEAVETAGGGTSELVGILRNDDLYFMMQRAGQRKFRTG